MAPILRGEIRHVIVEPANVRGHEQGSDRPALILSNDRFNATSKLVIVALIGSSELNADRPLSYRIKSVQMPKPSWVLTDQIRTLSEQRITDCYGTMHEAEYLEVVTRIFRLFHQPLLSSPT